MKRTKLVVLGLTSVVALAVAITGLQANLSKGDKASDFKLSKLDGKEVKLSDLQKDPKRKDAKRVVVLDFWATWCPPCREETPHLQRLHKKYGEKGLIIIGVSQDSDGAKSVKPFADKNKLTYLQLVDPKHEVARKYRVGTDSDDLRHRSQGRDSKRAARICPRHGKEPGGRDQGSA